MASDQSASSWVPRTTDQSLENGQFSVIAVIETIVVTIAYWSIAYFWDYQWWLYIAAAFAPLILLRSNASVERGVDALQAYYDKGEDDFTTLDKIIIFSLAIIFSFLISYLLAHFWLVDYQGWSLFWRSAIVGFIAVAFAFVGAFVGAGAIADSKTLWIKLLVAPILIIFYLGVGLGIWLRSLWIRLTATLYHPIQGINQLPYNLREILWSMDFRHSPELLPQSKQVDTIFSSAGVLNSSRKEELGVNLGYKFIAILWYLPALLWRWSLKATLWLWWPIAFMLRSPLPNKSLTKIREFAALRVKWLSGWFFFIALAVMVWTLLPQTPVLQEITSDLGSTTKALITLLNHYLPQPPPEWSLRFIMIWACCVLTIIVWLLAKNLGAVHETPLADINSLKQLSKSDKKDLKIA